MIPGRLARRFVYELRSNLTDESVASCFYQAVAGVSPTKACFIVKSTPFGVDASQDALSWGVFLYLYWRFLKMADPAATLRIASTGAPIVDGVLLVLQSKSCLVAAYVVAQLAVEVKP